MSVKDLTIGQMVKIYAVNALVEYEGFAKYTNSYFNRFEIEKGITVEGGSSQIKFRDKLWKIDNASFSINETKINNNTMRKNLPARQIHPKIKYLIKQ